MHMQCRFKSTNWLLVCLFPVHVHHSRSYYTLISVVIRMWCGGGVRQTDTQKFVAHCKSPDGRWWFNDKLILWSMDCTQSANMELNHYQIMHMIN